MSLMASNYKNVSLKVFIYEKLRKVIIIPIIGVFDVKYTAAWPLSSIATIIVFQLSNMRNNQKISQGAKPWTSAVSNKIYRSLFSDARV